MGWLNPNREYLKGVRDGITIAENIIKRQAGLDEMDVKAISGKLVIYQIKLGDMIEWLEK